MAGFPDLVAKSQPAYFGGGMNAKATEGVTWRWRFTGATDDAGDPIDLTSATCDAKVLDETGAAVLTLSCSGGVGEFTVSATSAATTGLAAGTTTDGGRRCRWYCRLSSAGNVVQVWGPSNSTFIILPED